MQSLPERPRHILHFLRRRAQGASLDEIAAELGVTRTAAKAQLQKLLDLGYAEHEDSAGSVGRPRRRYHLSAAGQEAFPRQYSWLSTLLLGALAQRFGRREAGAFMRRLGTQVGGGLAGRIQGSGLAAKAQQLSQALNELGYQSSARQGAPGVQLIEAVNCVYHAAARQHPELCQFDISLLEAASGGHVELRTCIAKGEACCRFELTAPPKRGRD